MNLKIFSRMLPLIERFDNFLKCFYFIHIFWKEKVYHVSIAIFLKVKLVKIRPLSFGINKNKAFLYQYFPVWLFYVTFLH